MGYAWLEDTQTCHSLVLGVWKYYLLGYVPVSPRLVCFSFGRPHFDSPWSPSSFFNFYLFCVIVPLLTISCCLCLVQNREEQIFALWMHQCWLCVCYWVITVSIISMNGVQADKGLTLAFRHSDPWKIRSLSEIPWCNYRRALGRRFALWKVL